MQKEHSKHFYTSAYDFEMQMQQEAQFEALQRNPALVDRPLVKPHENDSENFNSSFTIDNSSKGSIKQEHSPESLRTGRPLVETTSDAQVDSTSEDCDYEIISNLYSRDVQSTDNFPKTSAK